MRILIGIIAFVVWGLVSVQWYVCGIKGLCNNDKKEVLNKVAIVAEQETETTDSSDVEETISKEFTIKEMAIYFPFAKSKTKMTENQINDLKIVVRELKDEQALLLLYGNTDNIGSDDNNYKLGEERANWVRNQIISYGLSAEKIKVESKGEKNPIEDNSTKSGRQKNRRVDIIVKDL